MRLVSAPRARHGGFTDLGDGAPTRFFFDFDCEGCVNGIDVSSPSPPATAPPGASGAGRLLIDLLPTTVVSVS